MELGKISKQGLITVCTRYPNVAHSIINLFQDRQASREESSRSARKSNRHSLPLKMKLKIRPKEAGYPPFILDGFFRDISVGGVCVVLDAKHKNIASIVKNIKDAGVTIFIPGGGFTLNVSGLVVWSRGVISNGKKTLALGIQFKGMTPKVSGLLVVLPICCIRFNNFHIQTWLQVPAFSLQSVCRYPREDLRCRPHGADQFS